MKNYIIQQIADSAATKQAILENESLVRSSCRGGTVSVWMFTKTAKKFSLPVMAVRLRMHSILQRNW